MYHKSMHVCYLLCIFACISGYGQTLNPNKFPDGFLFGTGTSAYQIEGAWNEDGKGANIWDKFTHKNPNSILDGSNADIACDSYHKYEEDVAMLKDLGVNFYRFSISWSRLLPKGFSYKVNEYGLNYYNKLIDLLIKNNITPMITMFHWDTPQPIADLGGLTNALIAEWFEEYARVLFENFGDRVKLWTTFNEPFEICKDGFGFELYQSSNSFTGVGDYMCGHNLLRAHARVYHLYNNFYKASQKGKLSISISSYWYEPATSSAADISAAERTLEFSLAWFADPIFSPNGDYPETMKQMVAKRSKAEGFSESRLPEFTEAEINYIRGTYDFFVLNHYSTMLAADATKAELGRPSFVKDRQVKLWYDSQWKSGAGEWLKVVPWGFRKLLNWVKKRYGNLEIIIGENGFSDNGEIDDQGRINYYKLYLSALLDAIHEDKVHVTAYTAWSLMDNFEWKDGYVYKFGLYHVNFSDPSRTRTPKSSAKFYKQVIANRTITSEKSAAEELHPNLWLFLILGVIVQAICF